MIGPAPFEIASPLRSVKIRLGIDQSVAGQNAKARGRKDEENDTEGVWAGVTG
ncbi:MAG: hypothetical protein AAFX06_00415 [Planctomycetota bacterium]